MVHPSVVIRSSTPSARGDTMTSLAQNLEKWRENTKQMSLITCGIKQLCMNQFGSDFCPQRQE